MDAPDPVVCADFVSASCQHYLLDRFGMLLYISAKCFSGQLFALHHLAETDTLDNSVDGLGQISRNSLYRTFLFV